MKQRRSVLDALKESPLANCTRHNLPWDISRELAAFECASGCQWPYQDTRLSLEYLDGLKAVSLEPYWYTTILKEEAARLDWAVRHDMIEHALSYIATMRQLLDRLEAKFDD